MHTFFQKHKTQLLTMLFYLGVFLTVYLMNCMVRPVLDDWFFIHQRRDRSLVAFLSVYYVNGNGRLISNALAHILFNSYFWLWRLFNALILTLCPWCIARIADGQVSKPRYLLSLSLVFLLPSTVVKEGIFWASGSLNYLWPITCALLVLVPFADYSFHQGKEVHFSRIWFLFLPALYAGMGSEQVGLCTLAFMLCFFGYARYQKKRMPLGLWALVAFALIGFLTVTLSPATGNRFESEVASKFPEFTALSLGQHIALALRWVYARLFVDLGIFVLISYGLLYVLFRKQPLACGKKASNAARWVFFVLFVMALAPLLLRDHRFEVFHTFKPFMGSRLNQLMLAVPYAFWSVFACAWVMLLLKARPMYALLALAAFCSLAVMGFSPTIYASGDRTMMVSGIVLCVLLMYLIGRSEYRRAMLVAIPSMAAVNLVYVFLDNFAWFQRL